MSNTIIEIITLICLIGYIVFDKIVVKKINPDVIKSVENVVDSTISIVEKYELLIDMSQKFVILAKKKFPDNHGEEKKNYVINLLKQLAKDLNVEVKEENLEAINETAYTDMKTSGMI